MNVKRNSKALGFSLIEVVVAVGIFALAIVGVIGLLGPTTKNVADVADSDAATRVVNAIQSALQESVQSQATGFTNLGTALDGNYTYYANKDGTKVGKGAIVPNNEKFFEFALIRNTALSGTNTSGDATAGYLAFTISLRWPAYLPNASGTGTKVTDDTQKNVMIVPAAITR
jgi:uncharacterized protein (TIGR02598 family)